jgi:glycosyltransferase involved in cell wall biosynthesis
MKYPRTKFLVVGDGELKKTLEALSFQLGISNSTVFTGLRFDMPDILRTLDLFVHTSLNEGLGRVIVEAMASGVPVIASNVGGVPDVVLPNITGILVPPADVSALAAKMEEVISKKTCYRGLAINGRKAALNYRIENMVEQIETLYKEIWHSVKPA